jgi:cell division protein FtsX
MKWGVVFELSAPGLAIGLAVVYGMGEAAMWILWIVLRLMIALALARWVRRKHFAHGFCVGAFGAGGAVLLALALYGTYTQNHPEFLENASKIPSLDPRLLLAAVAVAVGLVHGILQGILAWIASMIVTSR